VLGCPHAPHETSEDAPGPAPLPPPTQGLGWPPLDLLRDPTRSGPSLDAAHEREGHRGHGPAPLAAPAVLPLDERPLRAHPLRAPRDARPEPRTRHYPRLPPERGRPTPAGRSHARPATPERARVARAEGRGAPCNPTHGSLVPDIAERPPHAPRPAQGRHDHGPAREPVRGPARPQAGVGPPRAGPEPAPRLPPEALRARGPDRPRAPRAPSLGLLSPRCGRDRPRPRVGAPDPQTVPRPAQAPAGRPLRHGHPRARSVARGPPHGHARAHRRDPPGRGPAPDPEPDRRPAPPTNPTISRTSAWAESFFRNRRPRCCISRPRPHNQSRRRERHPPRTRTGAP
jgi:hypothetical protein